MSQHWKQVLQNAAFQMQDSKVNMSLKTVARVCVGLGRPRMFGFSLLFSPRSPVNKMKTSSFLSGISFVASFSFASPRVVARRFSIFHRQGTDGESILTEQSCGELWLTFASFNLDLPSKNAFGRRTHTCAGFSSSFLEVALHLLLVFYLYSVCVLFPNTPMSTIFPLFSRSYRSFWSDRRLSLSTTKRLHQAAQAPPHFLPLSLFLSLSLSFSPSLSRQVWVSCSNSCLSLSDFHLFRILSSWPDKKLFVADTF